MQPVSLLIVVLGLAATGSGRFSLPTEDEAKSAVDNTTQTTDCVCALFDSCNSTIYFAFNKDEEKRCNETEVCCSTVTDTQSSSVVPRNPLQPDQGNNNSSLLHRIQTPNNSTSACECLLNSSCEDEIYTQHPNYVLLAIEHGIFCIPGTEDCCFIDDYHSQLLSTSTQQPAETATATATQEPANTTTATQLQPFINTCGRQSSIDNTVPVGEALFGELPWMIALMKVSPEGKKNYLCGGSLIHPSVVLTAAHCVFRKDNLLIRAGEWDTSHTDELYPHQERNISQVVIHEEYVNSSLYNDVALLLLERPVELKADEGHVGLVCLPQYNEEFTRENCVASGWGKDKYGNEGKYPSVLKKVSLPVVARDVCQETLRKTRLGPRFKLHKSFICAGGVPDIDTCTGDGGAPLVCPSKADPSRLVQAGLVAWGIGCGAEQPAVYAGVASFVPWINDKIQNHLPSSVR